MNIKPLISYLKNYKGPSVRLMEVCGTHTAGIFKSGLRSILPPTIELISGPGCPVCVTPTSYIDKCLFYAGKENHVLATFGDMMKVPGEEGSLSDFKGRGAKVEIMYSPLEIIEKAEAHPETTYVIAAVGFETTAPIYALTLQEAESRGLTNIKLVTALKTVPPALSWICENESGIDGFICPGHVSVIIGTEVYKPLAEKYGLPFYVGGFEAEELVAVIYALVKALESKGKSALVKNLYPGAVEPPGNPKALKLIDKYFEPGPAHWRGLGEIPGSGLYLRPEYAHYDGGSRGLDRDKALPEACRCGEVIVGRIHPDQCPMFGKGCSPEHPYGPCMVSAEGACGIWFRNR